MIGGKYEFRSNDTTGGSNVCHHRVVLSCRFLRLYKQSFIFTYECNLLVEFLTLFLSGGRSGEEYKGCLMPHRVNDVLTDSIRSLMIFHCNLFIKAKIQLLYC